MASTDRKDLSLGTQYDRAMRDFERAKKELACVRELVLGRADVLVLNGANITPRQAQVLSGLRRRLQNKEIANELNVSVRTVKHHIGSLLAKTGCMDRSELRRLTNANAIEMATADVVSIDDELRKKASDIAKGRRYSA